MNYDYVDEFNESLSHATDAIFGDPCHEVEHSIVFFGVFIVFTTGFAVFCLLLTKGRLTLTGFDIFHLLLMSVTAIRLGPKLWEALQTHGVYHGSQTGCKLIAYTEFGLRHVTSALLAGLLLYAWMKVIWRKGVEVDEWLKKNISWLLLFLFALEGATGMVPAIFTEGNGRMCNFVSAEGISQSEFLSLQLIFSTILPYIVPFLLFLYPLVILSKRFTRMDAEDQLKPILRNILIVTWTYILFSFPWALHTLVMLPLLDEWTVGIDEASVCVMDSLFEALTELWFIVMPLACIFGDEELRGALPQSNWLPRNRLAS